MDDIIGMLVFNMMSIYIIDILGFFLQIRAVDCGCGRYLSSPVYFYLSKCCFLC